jgi:cytoskeletal protein CcmA (bactofilin family)
MAWFKPTEQKSPASPESQTAASPAAAPASFVPASGVQADQRLAPSSSSPAVATGPTTAGASRVSRGLVVRGEITGREDLLIDGEVEGTLRLDGARVTIGPAGRVRAGVTAREIVVHGEVRGDLRAEERIEIGRSGSVHGNAAAKRIAIEDGAVFNGSIEVLRPGEVARSGETASATRAEVRPVLRAAASAATASPAPALESTAETVWRDETVVASDSFN